MTLPIRSLPVLQNWDCHQGGSCCKEYQVHLSASEKARLEAQGWDQDPLLRGVKLFKKHGWFKPSYSLNHREDGSCVFLSEAGRCRIHEKFGFETKPLPCQMFPFILVPTGEHWRLGVRFACPSAAANLGRPADEHKVMLRSFAEQLTQREQLTLGPAGFTLPSPWLQSGQRVSWADLLVIVQSLVQIVENRQYRVERRLRLCLTLAQMMREAKLDKITGTRLAEMLSVLTAAADADTPREARALPAPGWAGRLLFRQALALFTRKDQGPNRGEAIGSRLALLRAAWRFARGVGPVPRLHRWLPDTTFADIEARTHPLSEQAEALLERYYLVKLSSCQFCGPAFFGLHVWEGLQLLTLTYPMLVWVSRMFPPDKQVEGLTRALSIIDDHFGFNKLLGSLRQRFSFHMLAKLGDLPRLLAWYSR